MEAQHDHQEIDGSSSTTTLKVKLKIPKLTKDKEKEEEDEDVCKDQDNDEKNQVSVVHDNNLLVKKQHICCECGKEFSSGKALGGHMSSAHVQANQRLEESWKKKKNKKIFSQEKMMKRFDDDDDDDEVEEGEIRDGVFNYHDEMMMMEKKIICDICGKNFPSKKSLFGHMRCHPDRDWRGMKPPTKKKPKNKGFRASFYENDDDVDDADADADGVGDVIRDDDDEEEEEERKVDVNCNIVAPPRLTRDLKDCLKGWGVKDKRGRSPMAKKRDVSITSLEDKELHDAVHQLISLVNGDNHINNTNNNSNSEVICSSNSVGSAPFNNLNDKSKGKSVVVDHTQEAENREETCSDSPVHKKRKREKELMKLEPSKHPAPSLSLSLSPSPGSIIIKKTPEIKYKCNICHKTFASHQALGGHRSSHNKFKITIENTIDHHHHQENNTQGHQDVQLGDQEINNINNNNNVHKCKICDKIFATGQALGGHQRSHWTNNQEDHHQDQESSSKNPSKVLDFDLNELPDSDDYYK